MAASVAGCDNRLPFVVMCTGPGRSAVATRSALRMIVPAASGTIRVAHLVMGA